MKRSELNMILKDAAGFFKTHGFALPPWACWRPNDWKKKGAECREIRRNLLGWDITDFGSGNFEKTGLLLFTIRNGKFGDPESTKPYAEKIMISRENQVTPTHFHWKKMEDIINRGGGILTMQLWKADASENLSEEDFTVQCDGITRKVKGGDFIRLAPGESITLEPFVYHRFWAENGKCLIGEVSMVNDDNNDNRFHEPVGRFPKIEEDEEILWCLCNEYP